VVNPRDVHRAKLINPSSPEPNSHIAGGTGTGA
jgi:hypothetical protein